MVTATELGYKLGEADVGEKASYRALRPQFASILSPADVLAKRVEELDALHKNRKWKKEDLGPWNLNYFFTSMGAAGTPEQLILNPNSDALAAITPQTKLVAYGIPLAEIPSTATVWNRADYAGQINRSLQEGEVADNPFWLQIADGNRDLLGRFVQLQFKAMKDVFQYDEGMGIYFPTDAEPIELALVLDGTKYWANAGGDINFDFNLARIVGVRRRSASEASKAAEGGKPVAVTPTASLDSRVEALMKEHGISTDKLPEVFALYAAAKVGGLGGFIQDLVERAAVQEALRAYRIVRKRLEDEGKGN